MLSNLTVPATKALINKSVPAFCRVVAAGTVKFDKNNHKHCQNHCMGVIVLISSAKSSRSELLNFVSRFLQGRSGLFFGGEGVDFEGRRLRRRKVKFARSRVLAIFEGFRMVSSASP